MAIRIRSTTGMKHVAISGCGGGYDVAGGLPLAFELMRKNTRVTFVNFSFTSLEDLRRLADDGEIQEITPISFKIQKIIPKKNESVLVRNGSISLKSNETKSGGRSPPMRVRKLSLIKRQNKSRMKDPGIKHFPEYYLSRELSVPIYLIHHTASISEITEAYKMIAGADEFDELYLYEGGCDALLSGRETHLGTPEEDMAHLKAISQLGIKKKYLCAIGVNIDSAHGILEDDITKRLEELKEKRILLEQKIWSDKNPDVRRYIDTMMRCKPENTIVQSLIIAAVQGNTGHHTPAHLVPRIGKSTVSIGAITRTHFMFDLVSLVDDSEYINKLTGSMRIDNVRDYIKENIGNGKTLSS